MIVTIAINELFPTFLRVHYYVYVFFFSFFFFFFFLFFFLFPFSSFDIYMAFICELSIAEGVWHVQKVTFPAVHPPNVLPRRIKG